MPSRSQLASSQRAVSFHESSIASAGNNGNDCEELPVQEINTGGTFPNMLRRQSTFWPSSKEIVVRHPSLEFLVPAHDCESRKSSPAIAIFNLVATVCGGGVLSLPLAFGRSGVIPSTIMMILSALVTKFAMYILCSCARRTGGMSYGDVMRSAFGEAAELCATVLLIFLLICVLVAFMVLLKDIWTPVIAAVLPYMWSFFVAHVGNTEDDMQTGSDWLLVVLLLCTLPLILQRDLHALRHTCYIGFASAVVLTVGVVHRAFERNIVREPGLFWREVKWVGDTDGILFGFPIIVLSYFSIYNVLSVHSALVNPTRERVNLVLNGTILICFVLFYIVGLCGYLYAYEDTKDNILLNFPLAYLDILVGRVGYGVTIMLGFPMVFLPCRSSILSLPSQIKAIHSKNRLSSKLAPDEETPLVAASLEKRGTELGGDEASGQGTFASTGAESHEDDASVFPDGNEDAWVHVLSTMGILLICYIMAVAVPGVGIVWSIAGSSMALMIGFLIPSICYLKIRTHKSVNPRSLLAFLLTGFSIVASIVCTSRTLLDLRQ